MQQAVSKWLLLLLPVWLFAMNANAAGSGSISGKIIDDRSGKPLEGVNIYLKELPDRSALTDAFGAYAIGGLPAGQYTIIVATLGYSGTTSVVQLGEGSVATFNARLARGQVQLTDVTVNAQKAATHSTISLIDVKLRPINTAQDMVRLVPGIFISQHQGGGKAEQMFLRGFDVDHGTDVAISVDDMPVNMVSHAHGQGYADLHFLIPELVDGMEFGKGPYTIDKGNLATAGWVAFRTKSYLDNSFLKLEGGTYGYARAVLALNLLGKNAAAKGQSAYIAGEYGYNRAYFDKSQDFNRVNLTGKYTKQIGSDKLFSATISGFHSGWSASGQVPERAVREGIIDRFGELDNEGGLTSRYHANLQYTQSFGNKATFRTNLYAGYYDFSLYSNFTFFLEDTVNGDQIHQAESRFFGGYNAAYTRRYSIGHLAASTDAGIGVRYDRTSNTELSHTVDQQFLNNIRLGDIRETNLFGYVNETVHLLPALVATAGARYDYFVQGYVNQIPEAGEQPKATYSHGAVSPKLGLYYNFGSAGRVYVNYGIGFHSNDTRDIYFRPGSGSDVLPLEHATDIGVVVKPLPSLLLQAAVFRMTLDEEYTYTGDAGDVPELNGRTRREGVDFSGRYEAAKWLYFDVDVNYTHARYTDEPDSAAYVELAPKLTSVGGITVRPFNHFAAGLRYRHMSDRPANTENSVIAPGYTVIDLTASYTMPRYEFGLQVQNLTNVEWNEAAFDTETRLRGEAQPVSEICFTPGIPFFVKLSATYKF